MFVLVNEAGQVSLEEKENFRAFKLVIRGNAAGLEGLAVMDGDVAWISEAGLRAFVADPAWQESLSGMIEKARPHGWVHPETGAIRAHIEKG